MENFGKFNSIKYNFKSEKCSCGFLKRILLISDDSFVPEYTRYARKL